MINFENLTKRLAKLNFANSKRSNVIYPKTSKTSDFVKLDNINENINLNAPDVSVKN